MIATENTDKTSNKLVMCVVHVRKYSKLKVVTRGGGVSFIFLCDTKIWTHSLMAWVGHSKHNYFYKA